jgi:hypothetical protein
MEPDDVLAELGLQTDEAAPGQGYQMPSTDPITGLPTELTRPGEGMPAGQRNGALDQARVLAQLNPQQSTGTGDRIAAGMGAKLGKAPASPVAAALDGGMTGFAAAYGAGKNKKGGLGDIKERMGILKTLFDMDRSLANDRSLHDYRSRSLEASERRTAAYEGRQRDPITGRPRAPVDPLVREKRILDIMKSDPSQVALDEDDALPQKSRRKLSPEARQALEAKRDARRRELEEMTGGPSTAAPATPSPAQNPPPVDSGGPNVNTVPNPLVDPATPAPATKAPAQKAAPKAPTLTREQIIEQGRAANQNGAPLEAIIGRAKERGFDLKPDDFLTPSPATSQAPGPQAANQNDIMGVLASLFG